MYRVMCHVSTVLCGESVCHVSTVCVVRVYVYSHVFCQFCIMW